MAAFEFRRAVSVARAAESTFVFPSPADVSKHIREDAVTKALKRICKRIGIERLGPHDLRRTVGTGLARLGVSKEIRSRVLNHADDIKSDVTTVNYDVHDYMNEKLDALTKWEAHVRKVVNIGGH